MKDTEKTTDKFFKYSHLTEMVINSSLDGILAFDTNFRYTVFNSAFEKITGMTKDQVIGKMAFEAFPFLVETGEDKYFREALKGRHSMSVDRTYVIPDTGKTGSFQAVYSPLYDDNKKIIGGLSIVRETTDTKKVKWALTESELKFRNVIHVASDAIVTCNKKGEILSWNKSAAVIFDYSEAEILGNPLETILPEYQWQLEVRHMRALDEPDRNMRILGIRKGGSSVPVEVSGSRWNMGPEVFLSLAIRDMSELSHLENQADEHKQLSETLMDVQNDLHQGIVVMDSITFSPIFVNQAMAGMLGYTVNEIVKLPHFAFLIDESVFPLVKKRIEKLQKGIESSLFFEVVLKHKKGFKVYAELAMKLIETSFGMTAFVIVRDITHRKLTEEALQTSERQYRFIVENVRSIICSMTPEGKIITVNHAFEKILGYPRCDWIGKSLCLVVHPEDAQKLMAVCSDLKCQSELSDEPVRLIASDGRIFQSEISSTAITDGLFQSGIMLFCRIQKPN